MSPLRLSPESTPPATLHEAIMDSVSSVRDSIPKQYHEHFNTLRQEIIDFAQAHGIPRDALSKPDALREAANKLPTPDLERFEHLIVHKEPMKEKFSEAREYAEEFYHLEKQYTSQVTLLEQVGILKEGVILGIDGNEYPIPTLEQIAVRLFERCKELETKHDQGFTKLLLVPFGMSLDTLCLTFENFLLDYSESHPEYQQNITPFRTLLQYQGADTGSSPKLVYNPQSFDQGRHFDRSKCHGQTKSQILRKQQDDLDFFPGWTVHLFQPLNPTSTNSIGFVSMKRKGEGHRCGDIVHRFDMETGKSSKEYFQMFEAGRLNPDAPYYQESGLTPEDWIMTFMTHLVETGEALDYVENKNTTTFLVRAFFPWSAHVPSAYQSHIHQYISFDTHSPFYHDDDAGVRSSIIV